MTVETMSRRDAETERAQLVAEINERYGTDDREDLRDLSLSGDLTFEEVGRMDRLRTLDYLLGE